MRNDGMVHLAGVFVFLLFSCQTAPEVALAEDYLNLGYAYYELKNWNQAERFLNRAIQLNPANHAARFNLALTLLQLSKPEEAISQLEILLQDDPENTALLKTLGYAYYWKKDFEASRRTYQKALSILVQDRDTQFNLGLIAYELKEDNEAKKLLEDWMSGETSVPDSLWPILENLYRRLNDDAGLTRVLAKIIEKNKNDQSRLLELAGLYAKAGHWEERVALLIQLDSLQSLQGKPDPRQRWDIGETFLFQLRQQDPALEWFGKAIQAGFRDVQRAEVLLARTEVLNPELIRSFFIEKRLLTR